MTIQKVTVVAVNGHQGPYGTPYSQFCTDASLHVLTENDPSNILILQSDGQEGFDHLMKNSKTHLFDYVIEVNIDHITHESPSVIIISSFILNDIISNSDFYFFKKISTAILYTISNDTLQ